MKAVLFGAGEVCQTFIERIPKRFSVLAIADNNKKLHGGFKSGIPIIPPHEIHIYEPDFIILSCLSRHFSDIYSQLVELGLDSYYLPFPHDHESEKKDKKNIESQGVIGGEILKEINDSKNENGSLFYHIYVGNKFDEIRREFCSKSVNRHLHIGSGHSLGVEIYSILRWGGEWTAIEPFPGLGLNYPLHEHVFMLKELMDIFGIAYNNNSDIFLNYFSKSSYISGDKSSASKINYFPGVKLEEFSDSIKYDVCYSCAVMEHVADIETFVIKTYDLLSPGGVAFHFIDLRDHRDFSKPLDFLKLGKLEWSDIYSDAGYFIHGNQLRYSDYKKMFLQHGFAIVAEDCYMNNSKDYIDKVSVNFSDEYNDLSWEDLEVAAVLFVLEKPNIIG